MSTDDEFEAMLRGRLHDLADAESGWDDPAPEARRRAAAVDVAEVVPAAPARRRWLPTLAVAAVLLAAVVAGGFGIRELARSGSESAGSASVAAGDMANPAPGSAAPGGSGEGSSASCADLGPASSGGPLAGNGSIRPGGIVGPRVASGGTVEIPYVLSFADAGGTVQVRQPEVLLVVSGRLVGTGNTLGSDLAQALPVAAGVAASGSVTFHATDCEGQPLPAGGYEVAVVYPYTADGAPETYLVSAPVLAVVS